MSINRRNRSRSGTLTHESSNTSSSPSAVHVPVLDHDSACDPSARRVEPPTGCSVSLAADSDDLIQYLVSSPPPPSNIIASPFSLAQIYSEEFKSSQGGSKKVPISYTDAMYTIASTEEDPPFRTFSMGTISPEMPNDMLVTPRPERLEPLGPSCSNLPVPKNQSHHSSGGQTSEENNPDDLIQTRIERRRQRNRLAAQRSRLKRLSRIQELEKSLAQANRLNMRLRLQIESLNHQLQLVVAQQQQQPTPAIGLPISLTHSTGQQAAERDFEMTMLNLTGVIAGPNNELDRSHQ